MLWMCVVACELLCRAVPPAIAAQVALSALHVQISDKRGSVDDYDCDELQKQ